MRADIYGGVPAKDLKVEAESLQTFKTRVDGILRKLEGSAASQGKMAEQRVARTSFGGSSLGEADALYTQYNRVHDLLTNLSRTLSDQIEAMGIAVQGAKNGFQSLDDDVRRRFWELQTRADNRYEDQKRGQQERQRTEDVRMGKEPKTSGPGHDKGGKGL